MRDKVSPAQGAFSDYREYGPVSFDALEEYAFRYSFYWAYWHAKAIDSGEVREAACRYRTEYLCHVRTRTPRS